MSDRQFWIVVVLVAAITMGVTMGALKWNRLGPHAASIDLISENSDARFGMNRPFPRFALVDLDGRRHDLSEERGKVIVLLVQGDHCPCSKAYIGRVNAIQRDYAPKGVEVWAFNPNVNETPAETRAYIKRNNVQYPVAYDKGSTLADMINAACMTETWVVDQQGVLRYHGRIDDNIYHPDQVKEQDLRIALDSILAEKPVRPQETRALACSITRAGA